MRQAVGRLRRRFLLLGSRTAPPRRLPAVGSRRAARRRCFWLGLGAGAGSGGGVGSAVGSVGSTRLKTAPATRTEGSMGIAAAFTVKFAPAARGGRRPP